MPKIRFLSVLVFLCLTLGTCLPGTVGRSHAASGHRTATFWPPRAQAILRLPVGSGTYLSAYAGLVSDAYGPNGIFAGPHAPNSDSKALPRFLRSAHGKAAMSAVAAAITVTGVPSDLFFRRVVAAVGLNGQPIKNAQKTWIYSTAGRRFYVNQLFYFRAEALYKSGKNRRAARYAKTFLFLESQEQLNFGPLLWLSMDKRFLDAPGMPPGLGHRFAAIRRREFRRYATRQKWPTALTYLLVANTGPKAKPNHGFSAKFIGMAGKAIHGIRGHLHSQYMFLRGILYDRRKLAAAGQTGLAKNISAVLKKWAGAIQHDRHVGPLEKKALGRWIREASLP